MPRTPSRRLERAAHRLGPVDVEMPDPDLADEMVGP